jgi:peroxiredoxin Q/BCP
MKTKYIITILTLITVLGSASLRAMPQMGDPAPEFQGTDQNTNTVKLTDYAGKKNVLLYFYPKDFTGGCTKEACGFRDRMGELASENVAVVGVSCDTNESHYKFAQEYNLKFPLIADTGAEIATAYGVKMKDMNMAQRVSFLIGTDGKIVQITESRDPEKHFTEMQKAIADIKK